MGWTTWDLQDIHRPEYNTGWLNSKHVREQADVMHRVLQSHGYLYVNVDSGWCGGYDGYGRPIPDLKTFPEGIDGLAKYVHGMGQKLGIYWIPGVQKSVYDANPPILGTPYHVRDIVATPHVAGNAFGDWHMKIDFTKPGAQEFIDSIAALWASWGIDYLKLDGVGPGSDSDVDSRDNVKAYYTAFQKTGRPVWLEISWRVDHRYAPFWQQYSHGRRVNDDVDSLTNHITGWSQITRRFQEAPPWSQDAGPGKGWNDFDAAPVGNGEMDGLTDDERQSVMTLWAIECAPLYIGDDLTKLDAFGLKLLTNDDVIAINQAGRPAVQMIGGARQVWRTDNGDGTVTVGLFNLGDKPATVTMDWSFLGLKERMPVRDLWSGKDLGVYAKAFRSLIPPHGSRLIRVGTKRSSPPIVAHLQAAAGLSSVGLSWAASPGAISYSVWRSTRLASGYRLMSVDVKGPSYTDRTVKNGTAYFYQVAATGKGGTSALSNAVTATPSGPGQGRAISVDFVGDAIPMDIDEIAGVVPALNWNAATCRYGNIDLTDSAGNRTGATLKYDAGGTYVTPIPDLPGNNRMMKGYLETYGTSTTKITVSSLPRSFTERGYDVYLYCDGGNGDSARVAKFRIGDVSINAKDTAGSFYNGKFTSTAGPTANYVKFENLKDDSFTLFATPVSSTDVNLRAPINGIQIVAR